MNASTQYQILVTIEERLALALVTARGLPGHEPLSAKISQAYQLAMAWRCDQEAELPANDER